MRRPSLPAHGRPIALLAGVALSWFAASIFVAVAADDLARGAWYGPPQLAAAHLVGLGALSTAIAAVLLHLGPTMTRAPILFGIWPGALLLTGSWMLAMGLWRGVPPLEAVGGAFAALGGLGLAAAIGGLWRERRGTWSEPRYGLSAGAIWLVVVVVVGVLMVAERRHPFLGMDRSHLIAAHGAAAVLGWIGSSIVGVGSRMVPMMLMVPPQRLWRARAALAIWQAGVILLVIGLATGTRAGVIAGTLVLPAALVVWFGYLVDAFRRRQRPPGPAVPQVALGIACLVAAGVFVIAAPPGRAASAGLVLALVGFGGGVTTGHLQVLLPTMCWRVRFGGLRRRTGPVPPVAHLAPAGITRPAGMLFALSLALLGVGLAGALPTVATIGGAVLVASASCVVGVVAVALLRPPPRAEPERPAAEVQGRSQELGQ